MSSRPDFTINVANFNSQQEGLEAKFELEKQEIRFQESEARLELEMSLQNIICAQEKKDQRQLLTQLPSGLLDQDSDDDVEDADLLKLPGAFNIEWTDEANAQLASGFSFESAQALHNVVAEQLSNDACRVHHKCLKQQKGLTGKYRRLRVGNVRVVYVLVANIIHIVGVFPRSDSTYAKGSHLWQAILRFDRILRPGVSGFANA